MAMVSVFAWAIALFGCTDQEWTFRARNLVAPLDAAQNRDALPLDALQPSSDTPASDALRLDREPSDAGSDSDTDVAVASDTLDAAGGDVSVSDDVADVVLVDATDAATDRPRLGATTSMQQRSCPDGGVGCGIVEVVGGTFTMGAAVCDAMPDATCAVFSAPPQPNISVGDFALDAHEVTVARFRMFWRVRSTVIDTIRSQPIVYPNGSLIVWRGTGQEPFSTNYDRACNWSSTPELRELHPVNCLDWWTAQEFCAWDGGRLPTEAEWEYAARFRDVSGLTGGRLYPWGNTLPMSPCDRARWGTSACSGADGAATRRVGSFPSGASGGLYDLAGNVREWTADSFATFGASPCWRPSSIRDPLCLLDTTRYRTTRGGSWNYNDVVLRSASRILNLEERIDPPDTGLRCARTR
jgi:formylglycine-generating enzyme required for sulfatase activity